MLADSGASGNSGGAGGTEINVTDCGEICAGNGFVIGHFAVVAASNGFFPVVVAAVGNGIEGKVAAALRGDGSTGSLYAGEGHVLAGNEGESIAGLQTSQLIGDGGLTVEVEILPARTETVCIGGGGEVKIAAGQQCQIIAGLQVCRLRIYVLSGLQAEVAAGGDGGSKVGYIFLAEKAGPVVGVGDNTQTDVLTGQVNIGAGPDVGAQ